MIPIPVIIAMCLLVLAVAIHAWKGWETAKSLRQIIMLGPVVCEVCATRATNQSHDSQPSDQILSPSPCEGGMMWKETHQFVPARLVYAGPYGTKVHR